MIDAILASKLYRTSTRKDKITAALENQANQGLVVQLRSYLDPEYRDLATPGDKKEEVSEESAEELSEEHKVSAPADGEENEGGFDIPSSMRPDLGADFNPSENLAKMDSETESSLDSEMSSESSSESSESAPAPEPVPAKVEEATSINACTEIQILPEVLKGSLNSVEETKGVSRIQVKDHELWIYYNDDTNLNNIMTDIIEYLNSSGHTYLEFNRLARSDNAIVFVIDNAVLPLKPIETVEGKK